MNEDGGFGIQNGTAETARERERGKDRREGGRRKREMTTAVGRSVGRSAADADGGDLSGLGKVKI